MEKISEIASIITLILFVIFFLGKVIRISRIKNFVWVNLEVYNDLDSYYRSLNVVAEYDIGSNNSERIIMSSEVPINWIKVYEYEYDENLNMKKGKLTKEHGLLKSGHSIQFNTYLSCGLPGYVIEFQRDDYMKGAFDLVENNKSGVLSEFVRMRHTLFSFLYYIFE